MLSLHAYDDNLEDSGCQYPEAVQGNSRPVALDGLLTSRVSLAEAVGWWLKSLYLSNGSQTQEKLRRKQARFLMRAFRGVTVGLSKGYRFRWFVLTESDAAIAAHKVFGREFNRFVTWLRYHCPSFEYIVVEHGFPRRHWHILSYGSDKLPVHDVREYWRDHYLSTVTGMAEVKHIEKAIYYVAGYLKKSEKYVRSWSSSGWVFGGWLGFTRAYKSLYGEYPSAAVISELALLEKGARDYEKLWLLETGYNSRLYLGDEVSDGKTTAVHGSEQAHGVGVRSPGEVAPVGG